MFRRARRRVALALIFIGVGLLYAGFWLAPGLVHDLADDFDPEEYFDVETTSGGDA